MASYEYTIVCNGSAIHPCAHMTSEGGFNAPVKFTDEQVLEHAMHNPGCLIGFPDPERPVTPIIASEQDTEEDINITRYTISAQ